MTVRLLTEDLLPYWPAFVRPRKDELLSSWLVRLAHNHNTKVYTFCKLTWPNQAFWNRDIDRMAPLNILETLSLKTDTSLERAINSTIPSLNGKLFLKHNPNGNSKWIMPLGIFHRKRRDLGLMFCPSCLNKDGDTPYFRKQWRLAISFVCPECGCFLHDCCPNCHSPIIFFRNELGYKDLIPKRKISYCFKCSIDLSKVRPERADDLLISNQIKHFTSIAQGYVIIDERPIYSHLYFDILHHVIKLILSRNQRLYPFQKEICTRFGFEMIKQNKNTTSYLEFLNVHERARLVLMGTWLLDNWPSRFINVFKPHMVYSSILFKDLVEIPYWYYKAVYDNFYISNVNRTFQVYY